jgi:hypothetical protein
MEIVPIHLSDYFDLGKTQPQLDFVDIPINRDIKLFIDPFAISQRLDQWSIDCNNLLLTYFQLVIDNIRSKNKERAIYLLSNLKEPNETRFGFSKGKPRGNGVGPEQAELLYKTLSKSSPVKTGFISSLEECELMIPGINHDKISDLTTNIIRKVLIEYTISQCNLLNIPMNNVPIKPFFSLETHSWVSQYSYLPEANGFPLLFIPKIIARYSPAYNHQKYFKRFILDFLQAEHLNARTSLVHTLVNGKLKVYKNEIEAKFPCTKENIFKFSKKHPEVLNQYKDQLKVLERRGEKDFVTRENENLIAEILQSALNSIPTGNDSASDYHNLMIGIVEFIFYPDLFNPIKEVEIHQGRKRIDINMTNGAKSGIFLQFHQIRGIPCSYIPFECKNYQTDVANPEIDQLSSRYSTNRGKIGFLCCRRFEDRKLFINRCHDTFTDDRGLIIPLDDSTIIEILDEIRHFKRYNIERILHRVVNEVSL